MPFYTLKKAWDGKNPETTKSIEFADAESAAPLIAAGIVEASPDPNGDIADRVQKSLMGSIGDMVTKALEPHLKALATVNRGSLHIVSGASHIDKTKSFGDFLLSIANRDTKRISECYVDTTKAPLAELTGSGGGFLVPPEYMPVLLRLSTERGIVRPLARVIPMGSRTIQIPALKQSGAAVAGQFQSLGGMVATWTEEASTRQETEPSFRQVELIAHELAGYSVASRSLMADSAQALDAFLTGMFSEAIRAHEDLAFLTGDGVAKPLGVLANGFKCAASATRGTANTFKLVDAANMWAKLLPSSMDNAVWVMNQSLIPQLIQMQDSAGRVVFIPTGFAANDQGGAVQQKLVPMLFGRPILFTEKLPYLGTKGDAMLCDFSFYLLGDRQQIEIMSSEHVNFLKNQITWRFLHRVDGQPWLDGPYRYQDGTSVVSPFVVLSA